MKKPYLALSVCLALGLAGCNDGLDISVSEAAPPASSVTLPPDPGEAGKQTIEGIDVDTDGVRDDVQRAIYERYPDDEDARKAMAVQARSLQSALTAGASGDDAAIQDAAAAISVANKCLVRTMDNPIPASSFIERQMVNTDARSDAYIQFNESLDGQFFGSKSVDNPCQ